MYGAGYLFFIFRTEISGDDHAAAHGGSHKEADHQEDQVARRGDCRQRVCAEIPPDDEGVRSVVELLEDFAQKDGHGEAQHQGIGIPRGHVKYVCSVFGF